MAMAGGVALTVRVDDGDRKDHNTRGGGGGRKDGARGGGVVRLRSSLRRR
ncbi:hypothetical protein ACP4OV_017787 [Aristida adscensionis]